LASGLVVAQVALSLVLVVAAGLFVRTFSSLATRSLGFDRDGVLVVTISTPGTMVDSAQRVPVYERVREAVRALSGVADAALSLVTPVSGASFSPHIEVSGGVSLPENESHSFGNLISPGWFATFGTPLIAGRNLTDRDRNGAPPVAVVNQAFAGKFLNGASPLGHTITLALNGPTPDPPIEIVGVAADAVYRSLREPMLPTMYFPLAQHDHDQAFLLVLASASLSVRSRLGSPVRLTRSVATAINAVNPQLALTFRPLADQVNASLTQERVVAMLSGFFGSLALLLAALGLYGVTSYAVARRRTELGIRMALGAAPARIVRLVLLRVSCLVGFGVLLGAGVSVWATQFVRAQLYGLEPRDPVTLAGASLVLVAVAAVAGWLPAWNASQIDPAEVLRES
jgi:predicted permease